MENFVNSLGPGDTVIVAGGAALRMPTISTVERVTKTLVILVEKDRQAGDRFRQKACHGHVLGGSTQNDWYYLREATPSVLAELKGRIEQDELARQLRGVMFHELTLDHLRALKAVLVSDEHGFNLTDTRMR